MKKHPNKQIRAAIEAAEQAGWQMVGAGKSAHCFCKLRCGTPEHTMSIWSTPKSPEEHAKRFCEKSNSAPHRGDQPIDCGLRGRYELPFHAEPGRGNSGHREL